MILTRSPPNQTDWTLPIVNKNCLDPKYRQKQFRNLFKVLLLQQMGTGGCFGPKKNKDEIYTQLIKQMHDQSYKITHADGRNLDIYQAIKQKISKKGYLKKFVDNLSTRRHKIFESLSFNYKLTSQSKEIQRHYVGLIIIDSLIDIVYHPESHRPDNKQGVANQDDSDDSSGFNQSSSKKAQHSKKQIMRYNPERRVDLNQQNQTLYDQQYFRLILHLFEHEKKIHYRLLVSLTTFCNKHPGFIHCEHLVWKTIEKLTVNIKKNLYLKQSCLLFNLLLHMTKDQACEQLRNHDTLVTIIKVWLTQKQNLDLETIDIQSNCLQIINMHFQRCICSWYSQFLYEVIFIIYDNIEFNRLEQGLLQKMYEQILKDLDLHTNFLRGLFNYLLCYLSITHEAYVSETDRKWFIASLGMSYEKIRLQYKNILKDQVKIECFRLVNIWICKKYIILDQFCMYSNKALTYVYLANSKQYRNTSMFPLIMDEYFKILSKLSLASRVLFVTRLIEDFRDEEFTLVESEMLIRLIRETVYRNILEELDDQSLKSQLQKSKKMMVHSEVVSALKQSQLSQLSLYLIPVSKKYTLNTNLQILKLCGGLIQKRSLVLNPEGRNKICELMYSIYCYILEQNETLYAKYQFVCAALSLFRVLAYQTDRQSKIATKFSDNQIILTLYLQRLIKQVDRQQRISNVSPFFIEYLLIYMIEELKSILHIESPSSKYFNEITEITNRLTPEFQFSLDEENSRYIIEFVQLYLLELKKSENGPPHAIGHQFSGDLYQQYKSIFAGLFASINNHASLNMSVGNKFELSRKTSRDSSSFSAYSQSRHSVPCQKCQEAQDKNYNQNRNSISQGCKHVHMKKNWRASDNSFQEVMDIMHF